MDTPFPPAERDLAAALLHSPIREALTPEEAADLEQPDPARWRGVDPAAVPALIAARVWPTAGRDPATAARIDLAAAELLAGAQQQQLTGGRRGHWTARRSDGADGRLLTRDRRSPPWPDLFAGRRVALDLSRILTHDDARGAILGPLAAWPVDT